MSLSLGMILPFFFKILIFDVSGVFFLLSQTIQRNELDRYKKMAEQHYKEAEAAKKAQEVGESDSGYRFDLALCRKTFNQFDQDQSGYLDIQELTNLAEVKITNLWPPISPLMDWTGIEQVLWDTFHPTGPKLTRQRKEVGWWTENVLNEFGLKNTKKICG